MSYLWLNFTNTDIQTELLQAKQEGINIDSLINKFEFLLSFDSIEDNQVMAGKLLDDVQSCTKIHDYPYNEPNDFDQIQNLRQFSVQDIEAVSRLDDKIEGAWFGRCAGCLLGKPIEGWTRKKIIDYLKHTNQWPLVKYIVKSEDPQIQNLYDLAKSEAFINQVECMPEDDDINYTVLNLMVYEKFGSAFDSHDIADFWLTCIPILRTCTAERVAYKNILNGIEPPESARYRNPYREWIGAQIRADFWGYIAAGDPQTAAQYAWRDARISHVKNGIYGEMFIAATIAAAFSVDQPKLAIEYGMCQIPTTSRLYEAIQRQLKSCVQKTDEESIEDLHKRWNEQQSHDWCHVIPNAEVVVMSLLHGAGDFTKSICMAAQAGFDTDCNAATVGSILGAMYGMKAIPKHWIQPLNNTVRTGIVGADQTALDELVRRTITAKK